MTLVDKVIAVIACFLMSFGVVIVSFGTHAEDLSKKRIAICTNMCEMYGSQRYNNDAQFCSCESGKSIRLISLNR